MASWHIGTHPSCLACAKEPGGFGQRRGRISVHPGSALSSAALTPAGEAQEREDSAELDEHAALISQRAGAVLGPYTILKEDHFRGAPVRPTAWHYSFWPLQRGVL